MMTSNSSSANSNTRGQGSTYSQQPVDIIDLTGSPPQTAAPIPIRPRSRIHRTDSQNFQRPAREVIDLDSLPDLPPPPPLPPPTSSTRVYRPRHVVPHLPSEDITRNQHDVVMIGDSPPTQPRGLPTFFNILRSSILGSSSSAGEQVTHFHYHIHQPSPAPGGFRPPARLNYAMNAAHIYGDDTPLRDLPGFKDDTYRAPPPARQGYTRSPTENMALICPQCSDELGKSKEDPKKEVWIGKCGHTYCGECAASHRRNKGKGAKAGRCIVDGCTKIISGDKGMIRLIL